MREKKTSGFAARSRSTLPLQALLDWTMCLGVASVRLSDMTWVTLVLTFVLTWCSAIPFRTDVVVNVSSKIAPQRELCVGYPYNFFK